MRVPIRIDSLLWQLHARNLRYVLSREEQVVSQEVVQDQYRVVVAARDSIATKFLFSVYDENECVTSREAELLQGSWKRRLAWNENEQGFLLPIHEIGFLQPYRRKQYYFNVNTTCW